MIVGSSEARYVAADAMQRVQLANGGGGTLYYKTVSDVSVSSYEDSLSPGEVTTVTQGVYLISESLTSVGVVPVTPLANVSHRVGEPGEISFATYDGEPYKVGAEGNPAFENSWEGEAKYQGKADGSIYVFVKVTNAGASAAAIFTLPKGFRPTAKITTAALIVETSGVVKPAASTKEVKEKTAGGASEFDAMSFASVDLAPISYVETLGYIYLSGAATVLTGEFDNGEIFTLPPGSRPSGPVVFPGLGEKPRVINPDGSVEVPLTLVGEAYGDKEEEYIVLDGLSFPVP